MAGQTHALDIGDDDLLPPWTTVFEVARAIEGARIRGQRNLDLLISEARLNDR